MNEQSHNEQDALASDTKRLLGQFVTAKLKYGKGPRQGWIISIKPLIIEGQSGAIYECIGKPVVVTNPPRRPDWIPYIPVTHTGKYMVEYAIGGNDSIIEEVTEKGIGIKVTEILSNDEAYLIEIAEVPRIYPDGSSNLA